MAEAKRIQFARPGEAVLADVAVETAELGPTELLLRPHVTLISPGTELARWQGKLPMHEDALPEYPITTVGYAAIGTVMATGGETGVAVGDRIYSMAPHASLSRVETGRQLAVPVPAGLADERAVFVRLATVSMATLKTTIARGGDTVAVVGLGLVGNLAAQIFQLCGMRVHAFDLSPTRRRIARACGIQSVLPAEAMAAPRHTRTCRLVIEATGSAAALASAVDLAAPGGEIVMIGAPWGGDENSVPSSRITRAVFFHFLRLRSGSEWEIPRQPTPLALGSHVENSVTALDWLADGRLTVDPLITHRLAPTDVQAAYTGLLHRKDKYLGVVLGWPQPPAAGSSSIG